MDTSCRTSPWARRSSGASAGDACAPRDAPRWTACGWPATTVSAKPNPPNDRRFKGVSYAARIDRTWPHGRQHGPSAARGRPPMRGLRQVAEGDRGVDPGQGRRCLVGRGSREEAGDAAGDLADGPGSGRGRDRQRPTTPPDAGDILIDGGNSYYVDDIRRAQELAEKGIHYVAVGTSGGVWGRERGYCLMIGGET